MVEPQRPSLRWDAAQRACRDGDFKTLKWLFENAQLFEDKAALREACMSGAWGTGEEELLKRPFSTTDSIRLHTMLQHATTRGHVPIVRYILEQFPAKDLHVIEWEIVYSAIGQGSVELLKPFVEVDARLVNMFSPSLGSCFTILFTLVDERELHLPVVEFLVQHGADIMNTPCILSDCAASSTPEVLQLIEGCGVKDEALCVPCIAARHGNVDIVKYCLNRGDSCKCI